MTDTIDYGLLGEKLRAQRKLKSLTLEGLAEATGVSVPTLSRVERGEARGLQGETLIALTSWLGAKPDAFKPVKSDISTPDVVELHLRADKKLNPKTAKALTDLFRAAYEQLSGGK